MARITVYVYHRQSSSLEEGFLTTPKGDTIRLRKITQASRNRLMRVGNRYKVRFLSLAVSVARD